MNDWLPDPVSYFLMLLLGAVAVATHYYKLFNLPTKETTSGLPAPISDTNLSYLAGNGSYQRGVVVYLSIALLGYFVLVSSGSLFDLAIQAAGQSEENLVGFVDDVLDGPVASAEIAVPLVVASLIITFGTVPPFAEIESLVRNVAYRAAGIPRSFYAAVGTIKAFNFFDEELQTSQYMEEKLLEARQLQESAADVGLDQEQAKHLATNTVRAFGLISWLSKANADTLWPQHLLRTFNEPIRAVDSEVIQLKTALDRAKSEKQLAAGVTPLTEWEELCANASRTSDNVSAVFALLAINTPDLDRRANELDHAPVLAKLLKDIDSVEAPKVFGKIVGALMFGGAIATISIFVVRLIIGVLLRARDKKIAQDNKEATEGAAIADGVGTGFWDMFFSTEVFDAAQVAAARSTETVVYYGVVFFLVAVITLSLRTNGIDHRNWDRWSPDGSHYSNYAKTSIISFLIVFPLYLILFEVGPILTHQLSQVESLDQILLQNPITISSVFEKFKTALVILPLSWNTARICDKTAFGLDGDSSSGIDSKDYVNIFLFIFGFVVFFNTAKVFVPSLLMNDIIGPIIGYTVLLAAFSQQMSRAAPTPINGISEPEAKGTKRWKLFGRRN